MRKIVLSGKLRHQILQGIKLKRRENFLFNVSFLFFTDWCVCNNGLCWLGILHVNLGFFGLHIFNIIFVVEHILFNHYDKTHMYLYIYFCLQCHYSIPIQQTWLQVTLCSEHQIFLSTATVFSYNLKIWFAGFNLIKNG